MAILQLKLEQQLLTIQNKEIIASGDVNVDFCQFAFDSSWTEYIKTAVFYQDKKSTQYVLLDKNNSCTIPEGAMQKTGKMCIGVFGIKGTKIVTSTVEHIDIKEGAISGSEIETEPTEDIFLAIVTRYQEILEMLETQTLSFDKAYRLLEEQNAFLEGLNAFDLAPFELRILGMEESVTEFGKQIEAENLKVQEMLDKIENSAFLIPSISVQFDENGTFIYSDERILSSYVLHAYFDSISVSSALGHNIFVESFDGYAKFSCTTKIVEPINCSLEVRRY